MIEEKRGEKGCLPGIRQQLDRTNISQSLVHTKTIWQHEINRVSRQLLQKFFSGPSAKKW